MRSWRNPHENYAAFFKYALAILFVLLIAFLVHVETAAQGDEPPAARLIIFHSPTCPHCRYVLSEVIPPLQAQYGDQLQIRLYDLTVPEEYAIYQALHEKYPELPTGVPQGYIDQHILLGSDEFANYLPGIIAESLAAGGNQWAFTVGAQPEAAEPPAQNESQPAAGESETAPSSAPAELSDTALTASAAQMAERFSGFSAVTVAAAGLLDGINPCAFTTIIFFVSYLALVGRKDREVLAVGAAFTLAVFLTYLALGLGLAKIVESFSAAGLIGKIIYIGTALVCVTLAVLSVWDYIKIRQGKLTEIALQLPSALKQRIHSTIRTRSRMSGYVVAAFSAGVLVSVFELACTGQVYLPTIVFMTGVAETRVPAIAYLVLYNLMFVVPLIGVFAVTYFGINSQQLTRIFQSNAAAVKLLTAVLFGALGVWLVWMVAATTA